MALGKAYIINNIPELFSIRLRSPVFLLHLTWINILEQTFLSMIFGYFNFLNSHWI